MIVINLTSLKIAKIEDNLLKLYKILLSNQNIRRYVTYLDDNPLDTSKADITEDDFIDSDSVVLTLFDPNIMQDEQVKIFLNPTRGTLKSKPLSDITYVIDIVVPTSKWRLKESGTRLRAYRILHEYCMLIDGQNVAGIGPVEIISFNATNYEGFSVLTAIINVNSSTLGGKNVE